MPKVKSSQNKKLPKSAMIRVPTPLIEAVRELSRLHREGHTTAILQGLQTLISDIDSNSDVCLDGDGKLLKQLANRVAQLESRVGGETVTTDFEEQLRAMQARLTQMESAYNQIIIQINSMGSRRQSSRYHQQPQFEVKLDAFTPENLAKRLGGIDKSTLTHIQTSRSPEEFNSWCRSRDPSGLAWKYNSSDGKYYPVR